MSSQVEIANSGISSSFSGAFGGRVWTSPGEIDANDSSYASVTLDGTTYTSSECLVAKDFGFEVNGLGTVKGIVVSIKRKASDDDYIKDNAIYLVKGGNYTGNNKSGGAYWSSSEGVISFGSPTDLWGASLLPEDVRGPDFGFMIQATYENAYMTPATAYVDYIQITLYFEEPNIFYGGTAVKRIFFGDAEVRTVYDGDTLIPTRIILPPL